MKAEHRHELKTNALAEWLGNFPEWARGNFISVIIVIATIAAAGGFYFWRGYQKNARLDEQYRFTSMVNQISNRKMQILGGQSEAMGGSSILFEPARNLKAFALSTENDNLAALALIKQAEALRIELHYRRETVSKQDLTAQIDLAKQSYIDAAQKASDNQPLLAAARFGLGLCEEELGNFDAARQIYSEIADNAAFEGTVSVTQAKSRLETMDDYKGKVVFSPKPKPKALPVKSATIQLKPGSAGSPSVALGPLATIKPADANAIVVTKRSAQEPNKPAVKPEIKIAPVVEPNVPTKAPDAKAPAVTATPVAEPNVTTKASAVAATPVVEPNITTKTTEPNDSGM